MCCVCVQVLNDAHVAPILYRSGRIPQQLDRYGYFIDTEGHDLGDYDEPETYR